MVKSTIYCSERMKNSYRRFGSAQEYYPAVLVGEVSEDLPLLFTQDEINNALQRATANPEDVLDVHRPWWRFW